MINAALDAQDNHTAPENSTVNAALPGLEQFVGPSIPAAQAAPKRSRANPDEWKTWQLWRRAIRDGRISHGAFRLWHWFYDTRDLGGVPGRVSGVWADAEHIAKNLQCKRDSVYKWNQELQAAGWLTWEIKGQNQAHSYTPLDGFGIAAPKW